MIRLKMAVALVPAITLISCASPTNLSPDFGNAVASNKAMHIINPGPADAALEAPAMEGKRAALAIDRYVKGETAELEQLTTSGGQGSSGSN